MASGGLKSIMLGLILVGLFSVLIIGIVGQMGANYDLSTEQTQEVTGGSLDREVYEAELETSNVDASTLRQRFEDGSVDDVDDANGIFGVLGSAINLIYTPIDMVAKVGRNLTGFPEFAIKGFLALLHLALLFGLWRAIRIGD